MNARDPQLPIQPDEASALADFAARTWDDEIVPAITNYIAIPAKSPMFDADWVEHGYLERVITDVPPPPDTDVPADTDPVDTVDTDPVDTVDSDPVDTTDDLATPGEGESSHDSDERQPVPVVARMTATPSDTTTEDADPVAEVSADPSPTEEPDLTARPVVVSSAVSTPQATLPATINSAANSAKTGNTAPPLCTISTAPVANTNTGNCNGKAIKGTSTPDPRNDTVSAAATAASKVSVGVPSSNPSAKTLVSSALKPNNGMARPDNKVRTKPLVNQWTLTLINTHSGSE